MDLKIHGVVASILHPVRLMKSVGRIVSIAPTQSTHVWIYVESLNLEIMQWGGLGNNLTFITFDLGRKLIRSPELCRTTFGGS